HGAGARRGQAMPVLRVGEEGDAAAFHRVERRDTVDHHVSVARELDPAALGQLTQGNPGGVLSHARARATPSAYLSASALMTLSVMSMRVLAYTTGSCRMRSNFSDSAICWITLFARSCTLASSSLRRRLRSSRNSRWSRCMSRVMLARSRSLLRRSFSAMVT